ncbi:hypothetical protein A0H76_2422 [Hepatospora eriocheir]|uniref:Uncharacterized protein n=1 Tax=Hepatospora eriocheir TaxID=1081669 RepID=A0A1X0QFP5_9MICR|nr:hypothetical protein A0H76_2422 [Hepatospora eriocheir]
MTFLMQIFFNIKINKHNEGIMTTLFGILRRILCCGDRGSDDDNRQDEHNSTGSNNSRFRSRVFQ